MMQKKHFICFENELKDGDRICISRGENGNDIWVFKSKDELKAFGNCPHMNAPLKDAKVCGSYIICPAHGNIFDFTTGKNEGHIACGNLPTYELEVVNGKVYVFIEEVAMRMDRA